MGGVTINTMKQRIAKKIYHRVYKSMRASYQNFAYYVIKQYDNTWAITIQPSTALYSRTQFIKAYKVLLKEANKTYKH